MTSATDAKSRWYDREGQPLADMRAWGKKVEDWEYRRVAQTLLANGRWVSTIWLGLDHQYGAGPPVIFETMVFRTQKDLTEEDLSRYSTETEAVTGHAAMCEQWEREPC